MPRYYFHIRDGEDFLPDEEGVELPNLKAAHREAILSARGIIAEKILHGEVVDGEVIEITDEEGGILDAVAMRSVVRMVEDD